MVLKEDYFSANDGAKIFVRTYELEEGKAPRAVMHIHHGMGEHGSRYEKFADALNAEGLVVIVHDVRGHGRTAEAAMGVGKVPAGPEGAVPRLVADLGELIARSRTSYPGVPLLLMGHSMGTVISQLCVGQGVAKVDALLLSAPPARPAAALKPLIGMLLRTLTALSGEHGISALPGKLSFEKFNKLLVAAEGPDRVTGWEWLNRDPAEVDKYIQDPYCGHEMSVGFWLSFVIDGLGKLRDPATHAAVPPELPILLVAGDTDFAATDDFGNKSYISIQQEYRRAGKAGPKLLVYPKARHELLHETNLTEVTEDIVLFVNRTLAAPPRSRL